MRQIKKYSWIFIAIYLIAKSSLAYALAPQSKFTNLAIKSIPHILKSNIDKKNNWYFLSGNTNPFTYARSKKNNSSSFILETGTATNYISLLEFHNLISFDINNLEDIETPLETGTRINITAQMLSDNATIDLKYLNDGRALRDLNRMFSGVDPRALKDIIDLLNREENPFMATPGYSLTDNKKTALITLTPKQNIDERITLKISLPKGYVFEVLPSSIETTIKLDNIEDFIGTDKDLAQSYQTLETNLKTQNKKWFNERNILYDKEKNEIHFQKTRVRIIKKNNADAKLNIQFSFKDNFSVRPKTVKINEIFTANTLNLTNALNNNKKLKDLYTGALSLTKMLITDSTVLAGVPNYITYFGRDTLYTSLFLFNHFTPFMQEHFLQQVISRASSNGECAHEVDTRYDKQDEKHYDYRMADSDLIFGTAILKYLDSTKDITPFLNKKDKRNRFEVPNATVMIKNLNYVLNQLNDNNLLGIKKDSDPSSGNWRDALNSLGRGKYPYDLNCVWPQKIIYFLEKLSQNKNALKILNPYIEDQSLLRELLNNPTKLEELKQKWSQKKEQFRLEFDIKSWRKQLKNYYENNNTDPWRKNLLHHMPIGKDKEGNVLYAYNFIYENKIPTTLPNGEAFPETFVSYSMCLDASFKTTDIISSDLSLEPLFYDSDFYQKNIDKKYYKKIFEGYTIPLSLGGLGVYNKTNSYLGFVVANPILAKNKGYDLVLTPSEQAAKIKPQNLSPWELLNPSSYHGMGAVWSFQKDFYTIARSKVGLDIKTTDFDQLYKREEPIRPEIFTVTYTKNDFDLQYKSEIEGLSINPCQLWNTAIISVIKNHIGRQANYMMENHLPQTQANNIFSNNSAQQQPNKSA